MLVSLCMIAYNEVDAVDGLFRDISIQDYPHEQIEIVFVDSMSTDGTREKMEHFKSVGYGFDRITVVQCAKKNQAFSWNAALMTARGDVIIRVDAHARIPRNFVSRNIYNLNQGENVVGGGRPNITSDVSPWKLTLLAAEDSLFGSSVASYRRPPTQKEYLDSPRQSPWGDTQRAQKEGLEFGKAEYDEIDRYCKEKGIIAVNTPKSSAIAVAELAFALMISVPNKIVYFDTTMKKGEWNKKTKRTELYGKRLALFGMGNIARKVAERARAFGMDVVAYDKYVTSSDLAKMVATPEEAVENADYISMHLPLTEETNGMMNSALISHMKKSPVIINTGRGKCVNERDMADALKSGAVSHFCTDVYSVEPMEGDNPLLECENITLTPHVGANSVENLLRIGEEVVETIDNLKKEGKI